MILLTQILCHRISLHFHSYLKIADFVWPEVIIMCSFKKVIMKTYVSPQIVQLYLSENQSYGHVQTCWQSYWICTFAMAWGNFDLHSWKAETERHTFCHYINCMKLSTQEPDVFSAFIAFGGHLSGYILNFFNLLFNS